MKTTDDFMAEHELFNNFSFNERAVVRSIMKQYTEQYIDEAATVVRQIMPLEGLYEIDKEPIYNLKWLML